MYPTRPGSFFTAIVILSALAAASSGASSINGSEAVLQSSGTVTGTNVTLAENGYVGTYVQLANPGTVSLTIVASGTQTGTIAPELKVVVADAHTAWPVVGAAQVFATQFTLPAGTYLVRAEFDNALAASGATLTIHSLWVDGATLANSSNPDDLNANALAAADSYIANFRRGAAYIALPGVAPGTPVHVQLARHAFRFATEVPGTSTQASVDTLLGDNPAPGSDAANYQQRLLALFNGMTPGNAGKWDSNEPNQGQLTMEGIDRILQYAALHDLRVRQHNLIWGMQQPNWVTELTAAAALPSPAGDGPKASLLAAIQSRIGYYVHDRATEYEQLDVYNESVHTGTTIPVSYWNIYGPSGIASIYNQVDAAAKSVGAKVVLCTNEYNVLCDGNDAYANWYREHIETLLSAGGAVTGIGSQYYSHESIGTGNSAHNASRVYGALNNLGVLELPVEVTEFGIKNDGTGTAAQNAATDAQILNETMRLIFGLPEGNGFTIWGFWAGDVWNQAPDAELYDQTWNITPAGQAYLQLMDSDWNTSVDTTTDANGAINFTGFYGDYLITAGSTQMAFTLTKGALPDLAIESSDIKLAQQVVYGRMVTTITATVHNRGASGSSPVAVRFTDNGSAIGAAQTLPAVPINGSANTSVVWSSKGLSGSQTITVTVDPENALAELTKSNNSASITVTLRNR